MSDENQLSDGRPAGVILGLNAADLVGVHGKTPTAQVAAQTCISTSAAVSVCGAFAFTSVQANALITNQNAIIDFLKSKGFMALT